MGNLHPPPVQKSKRSLSNIPEEKSINNKPQARKIRIFETKKNPFPSRKKNLLLVPSLDPISMNTPSQINQDQSNTAKKEIQQIMLPRTENAQSSYIDSGENGKALTSKHHNLNKIIFFNSENKIEINESPPKNNIQDPLRLTVPQVDTPFEIELEKTKVAFSSTLKSYIVQTNVFDLYEKSSHIVKTVHGNIQKIKKNSDNLEYELYTINKKFLKNEIGFLKDIETFLKIKHNNIRGIVEYFQDNENIYIVQNLIKGINLYTYVLGPNPYNEGIVGKIIHQILLGIDCCNRENLFSGEISLNDIYVTEVNNVPHIQISNFIIKKHIHMPNLDNGKKKFYPIKPPELSKNKGSVKSDIWNIGILFFLLLTGLNPFSGEERDAIKRKIQNNIIKFNYPVCKKLSNESIILIKEMLQYEPQNRITSEMALISPWIKMYGMNSNKASLLPHLDIGNNFKNLKTIEGLKNNFPLIISNRLFSKKDEQLIREKFLEFDKNEDGLLSSTELILGFIKLYHDEFEAEKEVEFALNYIIFSSYKSIQFNEFILYYLWNNENINEQYFIDSFKFYDQRNSTIISFDEFERICSSISKDEKYKMSLAKANIDNNNNKEISFEKFKEFISIYLKMKNGSYYVSSK